MNEKLTNKELKILLAAIDTFRNNNSLILIDNPETYLSFHQQRNFIKNIKSWTSSQVMFSTQSPYVLSSVLHDKNINLKYLDKDETLLNAAKRIDTTPIIWTEGKTDWKHLKKALERFQQQEIYTDLNIQFKEYENINMGDAELDRMVQTYCKTTQSKRHIFMFDRDNHKYTKDYAKNEFNNHKNNVYSFCIPKIDDELDEICIEFYYKEDDIKTKDKDEKRIFLGNEFHSNGNSKCGNYITEKKHAKKLDILDRDKKVFLRDDIEWENNIALSKNDFTNYIINDVEGFDNFDIEHFKLIFDVIEKIVND